MTEQDFKNDIQYHLKRRIEIMSKVKDENFWLNFDTFKAECSEYSNYFLSVKIKVVQRSKKGTERVLKLQKGSHCVYLKVLGVRKVYPGLDDETCDDFFFVTPVIEQVNKTITNYERQ